MALLFNNTESFAAHLQEVDNTLAPLYTIQSDEPLSLIETSDALRAAALRAGYTHRTMMVLDARSDWRAAMAATQTLSLFDECRLLELKIPTGKPGKLGAQTLVQLAEQTLCQDRPEVLIVVSLPRLDKTTRQSQWVRALTQGVMVDLPTINRAHLPAWIAQRLALQKQQANADTLQWIADKVEGNLLAAHQEIQKLGLLYPAGLLTHEAVEQAVLNVARYHVLDLRDAMLAGTVKRALHILDNLKAEGEALPLVLWAVGETIRLLACVIQSEANGQLRTAVMRRLRFFGTYERLAQQALGRVPIHVWAVAIQHAHDVDCLIKGVSVPGRLADPWAEVARLVVRVAGAKS